MKLIVMAGGLGNQMFRYALALSLRHKGNKVSLFLPLQKESKTYGHQGFELSKLFKIEVCEGAFSRLYTWFVEIAGLTQKVFPKKYRVYIYKFIGIHIHSEPEFFKYSRCVFEEKHRNELLIGTWQSEKYFEDIRETVAKAFEFDEKLLSLKTKELSKLIGSKESVFIHIRRGDYLSAQYIEEFTGVCTTEYYSLALKYITDKVENPLYYIFTDDKEWVKAHFAVGDAVFVDFNQGVNSWQDMYLMSQCKHGIIANSTFSWWGAWLNTNPRKVVIAPKRWIKSIEQDDFVPGSWIRL